jgi:putative salt-induced outer membrane protein
MLKKLPEILAGALLATMLTVRVAEAEKAGRAEAGFVMSRGNADTETANARIELVQENENWRHNFGVGGLYGRTSEATIASRWNFRWQTDRRYGSGSYWFGNFTHEDDRYSGFDYQSTLSSGAGHEFINSEETKLHGQIGVGYRRLRLEVLTFDPVGIVIDRLRGEQQSDVILNGALNFEHAFNEATKIVNTLSFESGRNNTLTRNQLALHVKMNKVLAIGVGLNVRNNSNPPPDLERTDTLTTLNLVYERKN